MWQTGEEQGLRARSAGFRPTAPLQCRRAQQCAWQAVTPCHEGLVLPSFAVVQCCTCSATGFFSFFCSAAGLGQVKPQLNLQAAQCLHVWHMHALHNVCCVRAQFHRQGWQGLCCVFSCRWFGAGSASTCAVLAASSQLPTKQRADLQPYTVQMYTSHLRGAGTDANVSINAIGATGSSGWQELPVRHSAFEQGQVGGCCWWRSASTARECELCVECRKFVVHHWDSRNKMTTPSSTVDIICSQAAVCG